METVQLTEQTQHAEMYHATSRFAFIGRGIFGLEEWSNGPVTVVVTLGCLVEVGTESDSMAEMATGGSRGLLLLPTEGYLHTAAVIE